MQTVEKRDYNLKKGRSDYLTPPSIYQPILDFIGIERFDCDVCCSSFNIPADTYITPISFVERRTWSYILREPTIPDVWLKINWMNPPYDQADKWIKKAYQESQKGCEVWGIIPNRTETKYFHDYILNNPNCFRVILQKNKNLGFLHPETKEFMGQYKNPLCIVYFGRNADEYANRWAKEMPIKGAVVRGAKKSICKI